MSEVLLHYAMALLSILMNFGVALVLVIFVRRFTRLSPSRRVQKSIALAGMFFLLTAGIGKLSIQTIAGRLIFSAGLNSSNPPPRGAGGRE